MCIRDSVDGGRGHAPLGLVGGLADLFDLALVEDAGDAGEVAVEIVTGNGDGAVVAPFLGIAHVVGDGVQLGDGGLLGVLAHPGETADVFAHGLFQVVDELSDLGLGIRAEGELDILFAQEVAQTAVYGRNATGLTWPGLRHAGEGALPEIEVLVLKCFGQTRGASVKKVEFEIGLEGFDRLPGDCLLYTSRCV